MRLSSLVDPETARTGHPKLLTRTSRGAIVQRQARRRWRGWRKIMGEYMRGWCRQRLTNTTDDTKLYGLCRQRPARDRGWL